MHCTLEGWEASSDLLQRVSFCGARIVFRVHLNLWTNIPGPVSAFDRAWNFSRQQECHGV